MLLYKPFRKIPVENGLSAEIIIENWRNFRYRAWLVDQNPSIIDNIEDEEDGDFSNQEMNLEDDFQECQIFSHLVPPNDVNLFDLHVPLVEGTFDISFDWESTTIFYDVAEEVIYFIRSEKSRGDIVYLSNITFASLDSLSRKQ